MGTTTAFAVVTAPAGSWPLEAVDEVGEGEGGLQALAASTTPRKPTASASRGRHHHYQPPPWVDRPRDHRKTSTKPAAVVGGGGEDNRRRPRRRWRRKRFESAGLRSGDAGSEIDRGFCPERSIYRWHQTGRGCQSQDWGRGRRWEI